MTVMLGSEVTCNIKLISVMVFMFENLHALKGLEKKFVATRTNLIS